MKININDLKRIIREELERSNLEEQENINQQIAKRQQQEKVGQLVLKNFNELMKAKNIFTRNGPAVAFQYDVPDRAEKIGALIMDIAKLINQKNENMAQIAAKALATMVTDKDLKKNDGGQYGQTYNFIPANVWKPMQEDLVRVLQNQKTKIGASTPQDKAKKVTLKDVGNYIKKAYPNLSNDQRERLYQAALLGTVRKSGNEFIFTPSEEMKKVFPQAKPTKIPVGDGSSPADLLAILKGAGKPKMGQERAVVDVPEKK